MHAGIPPPRADTPPLEADTPPEADTPQEANTPPEADTPPWKQTPPESRHPPWKQTPTGSRHPLPRKQTPPRSSACWEIRSTIRRYASYWNAILFARRLLFKLLGNMLSVADPGFPRGEGANSPGGGRQHTILPNFPKNCMKLKEFGPSGGARVQNFTM